MVLVNARGQRIDYLSPTHPGKTHEKKIADEEGIAYPPEATLYKDSGFQGYEPAVKETCQAKKRSQVEDSSPRRKSRPTETWHACVSKWSMISLGSNGLASTRMCCGTPKTGFLMWSWKRRVACIIFESRTVTVSQSSNEILITDKVY